MTQNERAIQGSNGEVGNLKPGAERRESMEEAERCKIFFERGGFMDYLRSLNEYYFKNGGEVTGPNLQFTNFTTLAEITTDVDSELLDLDAKSYGGIVAGLDVSQGGERGGKVNKKISIVLYSNGKENYFYLELGASVEDVGNDTISTASYIRRSFYLNQQRMGNNVDNLLLEFTGELVDAKFIW